MVALVKVVLGVDHRNARATPRDPRYGGAQGQVSVNQVDFALADQAGEAPGGQRHASGTGGRQEADVAAQLAEGIEIAEYCHVWVGGILMVFVPASVAIGTLGGAH